MNVQRKYNQMLSSHVTKWFHHERQDSVIPAESILQFNNEFLRQMKRLHVNLWCSEKEFRKNMCEALCTLYISNKRNTNWKGPLSMQKRPHGWTPHHETEWIDYIRDRLFTPEIWHLIWCHVPYANWESAVPDWRNVFEYIAIHYLIVHHDGMSDGLEDNDGVHSYGEDSD